MESTIVSTLQMKALTALSNNIDCDSLSPWLLIAQQRDINPILGDALYNDIITRFDSNTLTGDTQYLYDEYIVPAIAYAAWYSSVQFLHKKSQRVGIIIQGTPDSTPVDEQGLSNYSSHVEALKDFYCNRLNDYLIADNGVVYPLFRVNHTPEQNSKTGGLFLGFKSKNQSNYGWE